jgi:thiol-disulfide isomerase/thioredoxin
MKTRIVRYLREALFLIFFVVIASSAISWYRSLDLNVKQGVCKKGVDIVYFWSSSCPVCKMESPNIDFLQKSGFNVESVAVRSGSQTKAKRYLEKEGLSFSAISDPNGDLAAELGVRVFPTVVFCKGDVAKWSEIGYTSTLGLFLRVWLVKLL